jgi:hypothetical protein
MADEKFNPSRLDDVDEQTMREILSRAGKLITSAWIVASIRHRSDGKWVPVLCFHDQDKNSFAYAFEIRGGEPEIAALTARLRGAQQRCIKLMMEGK